MGEAPRLTGKAAARLSEFLRMNGSYIHGRNGEMLDLLPSGERIRVDRPKVGPRGVDHGISLKDLVDDD